MTEHTLKPNGELSEFWSLYSSYGWYEFTITTDSDPSFQQRLAGHLETGSGKDSGKKHTHWRES
jgi:phospholipase C